MKNFIKDHRFLTGLLSVFISVFLVSLVAYGATTIGANLVTGIASTTESVRVGGDVGNDDDIIYFDSSEENLTWDDSPGLFTLTDDIQVTGSVSSTEYMSIGGDSLSDDDVLYFDAREENLTWDNANTKFTLTDDLEVTGYASSTLGLSTQGTLHVGGNITFDGRTTTTDYIYLPMVHFQQGVATSSAPNEGECFMPNNDLACYADGAWVYAW